MQFLKLTKIIIILQLAFIALGVVIRFFALFESSEWAWMWLERNGTVLWSTFLVISLPWLLYSIFFYYKEYEFIWHKKALTKPIKQLAGLSYKILILSLVNIIIWTINYENFNSRIDKEGKWINFYQRIYPSCQSVPPDLKSYYSSECK